MKDQYNITPEQEFALIMFTILSVQAESWAYVMKGKVSRELRFRLENFLSSAKMLRRFIEEQDIIDDVDDLGETLSKFMEIVKNAKTAKEKQEIFTLLSEYTSGQIKFVTEDQIKDDKDTTIAL